MINSLQEREQEANRHAAVRLRRAHAACRSQRGARCAGVRGAQHHPTQRETLGREQRCALVPIAPGSHERGQPSAPPTQRALPRLVRAPQPQRANPKLPRQHTQAAPRGAPGTYPPSWLSQHGHLQCHRPTNSACHLPVPQGQRPGCSRALPARSRSREHPLRNAPAAEPFPAPSAPRELRHPPGAGLPRAGAHLPASPMSTAPHPRRRAWWAVLGLPMDAAGWGGSALPPELPVQPGGSGMCPRRGLGTAGPRLRREGRAAEGLGVHARGHTPARTRTHTSARMHTHTRMHTPACTRTCTRTGTRPHARTCTRPQPRANTRQAARHGGEEPSGKKRTETHFKGKEQNPSRMKRAVNYLVRNAARRHC